MSGRIGRIGMMVALTIGLSACGGYFSEDIGGPGFFAGGPLGGGPQAVDLGLGALARGDFTLAERHFKGVLRKDPTNVYARFGMGVIYHTMGETGKAREMYESVLAQQPGDQRRMIPWNGTVARPLTDVANGYLALLDSGGVLSSVGGGMPPPMAGGRNGPAAKLGGAAAGTAVMGRGGVLPPAGMGGDILLAGADMNVVSRFKTLTALRDQGLITPDEFQVRRQANMGALLPFSAPPPSAGLERPVPTTDQIVNRLKALARSLETRNLTVDQHAAERTMILDALVPAAPVSIADARSAPRSPEEVKELAHRLDFLRKNDLVSPEEFARERAVIEAAANQFRPPPPPPPSAKSPAAGKAASKAEAAKPAGKAAKGKAKASGPQHGIHIASYRSQKAAETGWGEARKAAGGLLNKLEPEIRKVDLPKGTFYRLKAGPLPSKEAAADLCRKLKAKGQFCDPSFINID